jgi:hypothetical protein
MSKSSELSSGRKFDHLIPPAHKKPDDDFIPDKPPPFDPSKPYAILRDKERRAAVESAALLALMPPSFLLAFGSALISAFRGFRSA